MWVLQTIVFLLFVLVNQDDLRASEASSRQLLLADNDWDFLLGDPANAQARGFNAMAWRKLDLPHDWSIEGTFDHGHTTGAAGGFVEAGVGWYRKAFVAPVAWNKQRVSIQFDGVYMNAEVWLNGEKLGIHPYGYTSFSLDLTPHLKFGETNVLAVRVDNSNQKNSRWYSGSGIYRHVWLTVTSPVHIAPWGVFVQTPQVTADRASVIVQAEVENDSHLPANCSLRAMVLDAGGHEVAKDTVSGLVASGTNLAFNLKFTVDKPALWSLEHPQLCRAVVQLSQAGKVIDEVVTPFGIRSLAWSAENGLQLNGQTVKLCGGCIHHDNGSVGAAAFDRAEERRVELLKAAGFNAVRCAHNPPSPAFLDACDRLGMLVMNEAFDCWHKYKNKADYHLYFSQWWQRDLDSMVLRDRNHPSVFCWSIGNEIPGCFDTSGVAETERLAAEIHRLDSTRPVTEAIDRNPKANEQPAADQVYGALDIGGYNYNIDRHGQDHERFPTRIMVVTESVPSAVFSTWNDVQDHAYILGDFVWTAMDYLGESAIGRADTDQLKHDHGLDEFFPWHGSYCGDLDIVGDRKAISHYRNIVWNRGEKLFLTVRQPLSDGQKMDVTRWGVHPSFANWTWPGFENKPVQAEIYSRCETVQLWLNDTLIGEKQTSRATEFMASFDLQYQPGILRAVGFIGGKKAAEQIIATAGPAAAIRLQADRTTLQADGQDLSFVTVELVDKSGQAVMGEDREIRFSVTGMGLVAGVGNGDMKSLERYQGNQRRTFHGRALLVIRSTHQTGKVGIIACADGLPETSIKLQTSRPPQRLLSP